MKHLLGAVILVGLLSSCATQRFEINAPVGPSGEPTLEKSQVFFIGGVGQEAMVNAAEICGGAANVGSVETETSIIDGLLAGITGSIYSPRTARVYCL